MVNKIALIGLTPALAFASLPAAAQTKPVGRCRRRQPGLDTQQSHGEVGHTQG